jgi:biotin carboxyl carrier protein
MPRKALYVLGVVLVVALVGGVFYGFTRDDNAPQTTAGKKVSESSPKITDDKSKQDQKKTQSSAPATTPAPATPPTAQTPAPAPASNPELANTGPGEVVAVFIGTVVVASIGFSYYQRKRLQTV